MQDQFVFSGFGGQGVMFIGQLLAYAAMDVGLEVTWIPSYGPEMRGGTAHCYVVISDQPIGAPVVRHPRNAIAFNLPSFDKYIGEVKEGGLFAYNSSLIEREVTREDITALPVPASQLAEQIGHIRLANVVLLSAVLAVNPVIGVDDLRAALGSHIPAHRRNMLDVNLAAVDKGVEYAKIHLPVSAS